MWCGLSGEQSLFLLSIDECSVFAFDGQTVGFCLFHMADDASIDAETLRDGHDLLGIFGCDIDLHAVTHIEHFVHFTPIRAALLVDDAEQRRDRE